MLITNPWDLSFLDICVIGLLLPPAIITLPTAMMKHPLPVKTKEPHSEIEDGQPSSGFSKPAQVLAIVDRLSLAWVSMLVKCCSAKVFQKTELAPDGECFKRSPLYWLANLPV